MGNVGSCGGDRSCGGRNDKKPAKKPRALTGVSKKADVPLGVRAYDVANVVWTAASTGLDLLEWADMGLSSGVADVAQVVGGAAPFISAALLAIKTMLVMVFFIGSYHVESVSAAIHSKVSFKLDKLMSSNQQVFLHGITPHTAANHKWPMVMRDTAALQHEFDEASGDMAKLIEQGPNLKEGVMTFVPFVGGISGMFEEFSSRKAVLVGSAELMISVAARNAQHLYITSMRKIYESLVGYKLEAYKGVITEKEAETVATLRWKNNKLLREATRASSYFLEEEVPKYLGRVMALKKIGLWGAAFRGCYGDRGKSETHDERSKTAAMVTFAYMNTELRKVSPNFPLGTLYQTAKGLEHRKRLSGTDSKHPYTLLMTSAAAKSRMKNLNLWDKKNLTAPASCPSFEREFEREPAVQPAQFDRAKFTWAAARLAGVRRRVGLAFDTHSSRHGRKPINALAYTAGG